LRGGYFDESITRNELVLARLVFEMALAPRRVSFKVAVCGIYNDPGIF
jgi:hypothetical protein